MMVKDLSSKYLSLVRFQSASVRGTAENRNQHCPSVSLVPDLPVDLRIALNAASTVAQGCVPPCPDISADLHRDPE